jgi:hypothetical protein
MEDMNTAKTIVPPQQPTAQPQAVPQKGGLPIMPIVAVIVVVIIALGAYFVLGRGGSNQLMAQLSAKNNQTPVGIVRIASAQLVSANQFNVSYTGQVSVKTSGGSLGGLSVAIPFRLTFERYGNNAKVAINASGIPEFGSLNEVVVSLENGTSYQCGTSTEMSDEGYANKVNASSGLECAETGQAQNVQQEMMDFLAQLNESAGLINANSVVTVVGAEQYKGQGCVLVRVTASSNQSGYSNGKYNIATCLSDQYNVPLNLTIQAAIETSTTSSAGSENITVGMNESSLGTMVSASSIAALPGPIVSLSSGGTGITSTGAAQTQGNSCIATAGYLCYTPVYDSATQTLSIGVGQDTGTTFSSAVVAFVPSGTASGSDGLPATLPSNGSVNTYAYNVSGGLVSGGVATVYLNTAGATSGTLWLIYTTPSNTTAYYYAQIGTIVLNNGSGTVTAPATTNTSVTTTVNSSTTLPAGIDASAQTNYTVPAAAKQYMNASMPYIVFDTSANPSINQIVIGNEYSNQVAAEIFANNPAFSAAFGPSSVVVQAFGEDVLISGYTPNQTVEAANLFVTQLKASAQGKVGVVKGLTYENIPITNAQGQLVVQVVIGSKATPEDWTAAETIAAELKNVSS